MQISGCGNERLEELIQFIIRMNEDPLHHVGYFGVGEADIRASLAESEIPTADGFQLAYENGKLVGVFGVDVNPEIGRAWLLGPLVEHEDWRDIADRLYSAIQPIIPNGIRERELYCDANNLRLQEFAARHEFPLRSETAIYYLMREAYRRNNKTRSTEFTIADFDENYFDPFESLHNEIFPNTYLTAKQIAEKLGEHRRLLIAQKDERLLGYHFCKTEADLGYIDFIGAASSVRGMGVGAALLAAGVDWIFSKPEVKTINLTVHTNNAPARALYEKTGFDVERVLRGYRKTLNV